MTFVASKCITQRRFARILNTAGTFAASVTREAAISSQMQKERGDATPATLRKVVASNRLEHLKEWDVSESTSASHRAQYAQAAREGKALAAASLAKRFELIDELRRREAARRHAPTPRGYPKAPSRPQLQ